MVTAPNGDQQTYTLTIKRSPEEVAGGGGETNTIKIGLSGPLTGYAAVYGTAVVNAAQMAVDEINAAGGLNGIMLELEATDDMNKKTKVQANYEYLVDWGMQVSLGCVTSGPALEFAKLSKEDNVFFLTPSASADAVCAEANGYQMCFADKKQGKAAAEYFNKLGISKIGVKLSDDTSADEYAYSHDIYAEFIEHLNADIEVITDTEALKNCEHIFMPVYYTTALSFMQSHKDEQGIKIYYGCDGFDGIDSIEGFDIHTIPQKVIMFTHFDARATQGKAKEFIDNYIAKYGVSTLNWFGASAYDCVYAIFGALKKAAAEGASVNAETTASQMCEILKAQFNGDYVYTGSVTGTGTVSWGADGFVQKGAVPYVIHEGSR